MTHASRRPNGIAVSFRRMPGNSNNVEVLIISDASPVELKGACPADQRNV